MDSSFAVESPYASTRELMLGNSRISIGRYTYDEQLINIFEWGEGASLNIASFCSIASTTIFLGGNHRTDWITTYPFGHIFVNELGGSDIKGHPATKGDVIIGNDVWIGAGSTILSGVTIGDGAVIAANSTVTHNVQPYEIVGGNAAKHIRFRFDVEIRSLLLQLKWWELSLEDIRELSAVLCAVPELQALKRMVARYR